MNTGESQHEFRIHGMDCAEEIAILKREIGPLVGGTANLAFDVLKGKMIVLRGAIPVTNSIVAQAVSKTGMRAESNTGWAQRRMGGRDAVSSREAGRLRSRCGCGFWIDISRYSTVRSRSDCPSDSHDG